MCVESLWLPVSLINTALELKSIRFYKLIRCLFSSSNDEAFKSLEPCVLGSAALSAAPGGAAPSAESFWLWVLLSGMDAVTDLLPLG